MKKHVSNLELSRKLEELGVKQVSLFKWNVPYDLKYEDIGLFSQKEWEEFATDHIPQDGQMYSAFLASEIAESLPRGVEIETSKAYIHGSDISRWRCVLTYMNKKKIKMPMGFSETLVDALAEMKIYLLEHGLMEVGR